MPIECFETTSFHSMSNYSCLLCGWWRAFWRTFLTNELSILLKWANCNGTSEVVSTDALKIKQCSSFPLYSKKKKKETHFCMIESLPAKIGARYSIQLFGGSEFWRSCNRKPLNNSEQRLIVFALAKLFVRFLIP